MTRQGFSFLVCPDPELIKDRLNETLCPSGFSIRIFWGDEELGPGYWQALTVPAMMGPPNAVVLRRAQDQPEDFWSRLEPLLAMARSSVWPVFCLEGDWKSGKPSPPKAVTKGKYWPVAQKRGWIWEHPGLSRATIGLELDKFASANGLVFAPGIKKTLAESLPLSTIALRNELEKILLLTGEDRTVGPIQLATLNGQDELDVFAFLRSLQTPVGRKAAWTSLLNDPEMTSGDMIFPVSALLVREARILWQLLHGQDEAVNLYPSLKGEKKEIGTKAGPGPHQSDLGHRAPSRHGY